MVRTADCDCAYVLVMAVLIALPCYPPDNHQYHNAVYWRTRGSCKLSCISNSISRVQNMSHNYHAPAVLHSSRLAVSFLSQFRLSNT